MRGIAGVLRRLAGVLELEGAVEELRTRLAATVERLDALERRVEAIERPRPRYECRDWQATHDRMPGGEPTLHVTGTCSFPTGGYRVELTRHEPQGINPRVLLLDLVVTPPTGQATQAVTEEQVRYDERTDTRYDSVTILPDGPTIEVREVT